MRLIILLFIASLSFKTHAAVTNFRITGGTSNNFDITLTRDAWGVMAGPNFDPDGIINVDPTEPYNSCELPTAASGSGSFPLLPCHEDRVDGPTVITIIFNETEEFTGSRRATAVFTTNDDEAQNQQTIMLADSDLVFTQGQPVTLEFTWAEVCEIGFGGQMNSSGQCEESGGGALISGNIPLNIGISDGTEVGQISNVQVTFRMYNPGGEIGFMPVGDNGPCDFATTPITTGLCELLVVPGDEGASVIPSFEGSSTRFFSSSLSYTNAFTGRSVNINYTGIRLYFFESTDANTYFPFSGVARIADLDINTATPLDLDEDSIGNLSNDVTYTVLASSIDESGTISQFFLPLTDGSGTPVGYCSSGLCPTVRPSQIAGVIAESDCFITSATYGSSSAYQVETFQAFRERFLRGHYLGDLLISFYERQGPKAAVYINNKSYLKPAIRFLLFPFYLFSKLYLSLGAFLATSLLVLFTFLIFILLKKESEKA